MMAPRRATGGTIKMRSLMLVGLCALCIRQHVRADDSLSGGLKDSLTNKVVESAAGAFGKKPVELFVEDTYPVLVRGGFKKLFQAMRSSVLTLIYGEIEEVADMVMEDLKAYLFGTARVQEKMWRKLRNKFRDYLRDWWLDSLLDPYVNLKNGVWQALLKLTAEDLSVAIGGTVEYEKAKNLFLEENAAVIGRWVLRVQRRMMHGADQQPDEGAFSEKQGPFRGKSSRQRGKRLTNNGFDNTAEEDSSDDTQTSRSSRRKSHRRAARTSTDSSVEEESAVDVQATANE